MCFCFIKTTIVNECCGETYIIKEACYHSGSLSLPPSFFFSLCLSVSLSSSLSVSLSLSLSPSLSPDLPLFWSVCVSTALWTFWPWRFGLGCPSLYQVKWQEENENQPIYSFFFLLLELNWKIYVVRRGVDAKLEFFLWVWMNVGNHETS